HSSDFLFQLSLICTNELFQLRDCLHGGRDLLTGAFAFADDGAMSPSGLKEPIILFIEQDLLGGGFRGPPSPLCRYSSAVRRVAKVGCAPVHRAACRGEAEADLGELREDCRAESRILALVAAPQGDQIEPAVLKPQQEFSDGRRSKACRQFRDVAQLDLAIPR